jgi:hypothetical protein
MPKPDLTGSARVNINGNTGWLFGVNLPWIRCGIDFGESSWGAFGINSGRVPPDGNPLTSSQSLRDTFATMQTAGVNVARWFLFFDGRAGISYDVPSGTPTGLDAAIIGDLDAAIGIAKVYNVKIIFVLISFDWMYEKIPDNITGGRSYILQDNAMQDALINNVFVPVFQRYANEDSVLAYDVANEPEWAITGGGLSAPAAIRGRNFDSVTLDYFTRFVKQVSAAAQLHAPEQFVTLGSARAKWVSYWQDVGLDFYQFHYYPETEHRQLVDVLPDLPPGLNRPVWLGEFPANEAATAGYMTQLLGQAYTLQLTGGTELAGAAPWPMRDVGDGFGAASSDVLTDFYRANAPDINSCLAPEP